MKEFVMSRSYIRNSIREGETDHNGNLCYR